MNTDVMVGFGSKQAWLAVRSGDPDRILAELSLRDLGDSRWRDGIDLAHLTDDRVAVTPPLVDARGASWMLAVGRFLQRPGTPVDVAGMSERLGTEVQFFATHRVVESHRWQRAEHGKLIRAFGYVGRTGDVTSWYGDPDEAELAVGLPRRFRGGDAAGEGGFARTAEAGESDQPLGPEMLADLDADLAALLAEADDAAGDVLVSERDVLHVAEAWSIDPSRLDGRAAPGPLRIGAAD